MPKWLLITLVHQARILERTEDFKKITIAGKTFTYTKYMNPILSARVFLWPIALHIKMPENVKHTR